MNHQAAFTQFFSELEDPRQTTKIAYPSSMWFFSPSVLLLAGLKVGKISSFWRGTSYCQMWCME